MQDEIPCFCDVKTDRNFLLNPIPHDKFMHPQDIGGDEKDQHPSHDPISSMDNIYRGEGV